MIDKNFEKWGLSFSGCDGGNIGSREEKSIWFCGIEWGGGFSKSELERIFSTVESNPPKGYNSWEENLSYIFNWQAMKILSVIAGKQLSDYKTFAKEFKPFVKDSHTNYFKMNLYPVSFKNTSHEYWNKHYINLTNLENKETYIDWVRRYRFPIMKKWVEEYAPKLIICVGISYFEDFKKAFMLSNVEIYEELIDDKVLNWFINENSTLVVNIPFMVNRHGLTKNSSIEKFGQRILSILDSI